MNIKIIIQTVNNGLFIIGTRIMSSILSFGINWR